MSLRMIAALVGAAAVLSVSVARADGAAAATDADRSGLQEVVVTAQRRAGRYARDLWHPRQLQVLSAGP